LSNAFGSLSEADIRQLALLIESLEQSNFDYLHLQIGDLKVTIGKGSVQLPADVAAAAPASTPNPPAAASPAKAPPLPQPGTPKPTARADGAVEITAPILGVFYAQSEPGAPPFVTVGSQVHEDTTVALIEVMKTFNAVPAGVRGTILEVCAENAQMVEFGQVLFRVRPA